MKVEDVIQDLTFVKPKKSQNNKKCKRMTEENAKKLLMDDRLQKMMGEFSKFPEYPLDENSCFIGAIQPPSSSSDAEISSPDLSEGKLL